jgi:hypothetical protein
VTSKDVGAGHSITTIPGRWLWFSTKAKGRISHTGWAAVEAEEESEKEQD